ncbi:estradiol 17-beta-dehydrogenase 11-like [Stegodyphus dumicola]|uniref:estradiol 17-beta-dehydrogenase 11-like n=1 Tax=Stegodyphus dumicola TaxID=202533 RepID=UPI0015B14198|nr:estradiol 17-beta-dehydrogenase 11-like [Stegodyphus dumicola]
MELIEYVINVAVFVQDLAFSLLKVMYIIICDAIGNMFRKKRRDLKGETMLITGGGRGIGRLLGIKAAECGAKVVLWDIDEKTVRQTADEIKQIGGDASWYVCDITSEDDVNRTAKKVQAEIGDVSILVNNAGVMQNVPFLQLSSEKIVQTFKVNALAHFWTIRAFLPRMEEKNQGHIVAISSCAGLMGHVNQSDYSASKWAVVGMMESLSEEMRLKKSNIKFTTICPLTVNTGMNENPVTRFQFLLPILSPEKATSNILTAIKNEEFLVTIPRRIKFFLSLVRLLPHVMLSEIMDFSEYCRVPNTASNTNGNVVEDTSDSSRIL